MKFKLIVAALCLSSTMAHALTLNCVVNDDGNMKDPVDVSVDNGPVKLLTKTYAHGANDRTLEFYVDVGTVSIGESSAMAIQISTRNARTGQVTALFGGVDYDAGVGINCKIKK